GFHKERPFVGEPLSNGEPGRYLDTRPTGASDLDWPHLEAIPLDADHDGTPPDGLDRPAPDDDGRRMRVVDRRGHEQPRPPRALRVREHDARARRTRRLVDARGVVVEGARRLE